MAVYDQIKKAFQDIVAPEIRALQGDIKALHVEVKRLDDKIESSRRELIAEIRRIDGRLDSLDHELKVAIEVRERIAVLESKLASR